ncbi:MAG TPA: ATP-binding protein [Candidatus Krumholzibacteria bacterium]|nr:ATP-binding protein [Candidatus Krumholzibacteria bacterium]
MQPLDSLRRFRSLGLQGRFMLYFGIIVISLMTSVIYVVGTRHSADMLELTQMRGVAIANSIAAGVRNSLLSYDYVSLQQAAETSVQDSGVLYVVILDKEGRVAAHSEQPDRQGQRADDANSRRILAVNEVVIQRLGVQPGNGPRSPVLDIAVPVHVEGTPVRWGTVRLGLSLQPLMASVAQTRLVLSLLGASAVVVVLLSARFFSLKVTLPLQQLARATAAVSKSDLDHVVQEDLVGELGELARSFNKMTNDLKQSQDAIRYHNAHLEQIVQQRTAALHQKAQELEKANKELKEIDRLKSDFLSNVSHELRTPLTSIRSFTEIMLDDPEALTEDERVEFLGIIAHQTERLTRLISDLLDLSRIEAGEMRCRLLPVELSRIIDPCLETLRTLAAEREIRVRTEIDPNLPAVLADSDRISQVVTNLVDNAIKFTPPRGVITVVARPCPHREPEELGPQRGGPAGMTSISPESDAYVLVEVRDTGVGIPKEHHQRIFDKFGQVGNVLTEKPQGTGLGLAISGNIVVQHGGAIWVESAPGEGSIFRFTLPVAATPAARPAPRRSDRPAPERTTVAETHLVQALQRTGPGKQVLIVDDEPSIVTALSELLAPLGYTTVGCQSGSQAVAKARQLEPDVIILDIMMPEIDGYDVLRLLKSDPATAAIPVIVLSVLEDRDKAMALGASEYIRKPFEKAKLIENVRALV